MLRAMSKGLLVVIGLVLAIGAAIWFLRSGAC
jgi:hypothetical protein